MWHVLEPQSKISVIKLNVSFTLVQCSGIFEALIRKLVTPYKTNGVSKLKNWARLSSFVEKNNYRTTSEINFVIEQSHPVKLVQDIGFLEAGMWL